MAAVLVASKACWMDLLPVAETAVLKVDWLAVQKALLKAELSVSAKVAMLVASKAAEKVVLWDGSMVA